MARRDVILGTRETYSEDLAALRQGPEIDKKPGLERSTEFANRVQRLLDLQATIIQREEIEAGFQVWFFRRWGGVAGSEGSGSIMLVGINPGIISQFPHTDVRRLYAALRLCGLRDAHVTDAIKVRAPTNEMLSDAIFMARQRGYLMEEIRIVEPVCIAAMGVNAFGVLRGWLGEDARLFPRPIAHLSRLRYKNQGRRYAREFLLPDLSLVKKWCAHRLPH